MKMVSITLLTVAALVAAPAGWADSPEPITRGYTISDSTVGVLINPPFSRKPLMTLEDFRKWHPKFADADLDTPVPAGTEILRYRVADEQGSG